MNNFSHHIASLYIQGCHVGLGGRYKNIYIYIYTIGCIFRPKAVPALLASGLGCWVVPWIELSLVGRTHPVIP